MKARIDTAVGGHTYTHKHIRAHTHTYTRTHTHAHTHKKGVGMEAMWNQAVRAIKSDMIEVKRGRGV